VATHLLAGTALDEYAVTAALDRADTAVQPWYERDAGGSTLSIVTVTTGPGDRADNRRLAITGDSRLLATSRGTAGRPSASSDEFRGPPRS
jgi:hypothetical protein